MKPIYIIQKIKLKPYTNNDKTYIIVNNGRLHEVVNAKTGDIQSTWDDSVQAVKVCRDLNNPIINQVV